ncbi:MAG TPA: hypothetical protein VFP44_01175 [Usitatibacter sp.]|nr:hypothetical protein [Usitatibacter sp.]
MRSSGASLEPKRIFVVLGMHRSGTSAVARGLVPLGIELGDKLMPPAPGNNEKGFFEDVEANAIDNAVLEQLRRRWDSVWPIAAQELQRSDLDGLRLRAIEFLRQRLASTDAYGLKDPRISVLLPFWQEVFRHVAVDEAYILSSRHPLSVAASLRRRDGFDLEKSLYLWLEHVVACFVGTEGRRRVVVDFDRVMTDPHAELARIARALDVGREPDAAQVAEYARDFLSAELRHSLFEPQDLRFGDEVPRLVVDAYAMLRGLAADERRMDDPQVARFFADAAAHLESMRPALGLMARQDLRIEVLNAQKKDLEGAVRARSDQITSLNHAAAVRDARVHELNLAAAAHAQTMQELRGQVEALEPRSRALDAASGELHKGLEAELESVRSSIAAMRAVQFFGRQPAGLADVVASAEHLAECLARLRKSTDPASMGETLAQLHAAHSAAWTRFAAALPAVFECTADMARQGGIQRMRLVDSLRDIAALATEVERLRADLRQRDAVLAQFPHQFVSRLGAMLDPYPAVRSVLTAPMRLVHRLLGHARA